MESKGVTGSEARKPVKSSQVKSSQIGFRMVVTLSVVYV
jgi:hypothetical protein